MWRMLVVVVVLTSFVGCVEPSKSARWPGHRQDHDARLDKLSQQVDAETAQIAMLTKRIADLETQLGHAAAPPAPEPPAPPPPPSSSTVPASDLSH